MIKTQNEKSQKGLFSMPSCSEMAVWCELNEEIDPAEWAGLCRKIGKLRVPGLPGIGNLRVSYGRLANGYDLLCYY